MVIERNFYILIWAAKELVLSQVPDDQTFLIFSVRAGSVLFLTLQKLINKVFSIDKPQSIRSSNGFLKNGCCVTLNLLINFKLQVKF